MSAMRIELEHLDARGLAVDLPSEAGTAPQRIAVRSAVSLAGVVEHGAQGLTVRDVKAERVVLEALALVFGTFALNAAGGSSFHQVRAGYETRDGGAKLDLEAHLAHGTTLAIDVGDLHLRGETRMRGFRLEVHGSEGRLSADHVSVSSFRLDVSGVRVSASELVSDRLHIAWGEAGFRLEASSIAGPSVELEVGGMTLDASDVVVHTLSVRGADVSFAAATVAHAELSATLPSPAPHEERPETPKDDPEPTTAPVFDYALLDGLSGTLNVDLTMDMTVPIIGRRKAVHELRLPVDEGTVDYRELENDLSALEESLLDFSVRESSLVLERGIPLLPTRGLGKPLLIWDLAPRDLALAQRRRVRLAVLPNVRLADGLTKRDDGERESGTWSFALRRLSLENIDVRFALNAIEGPFASAVRKLSFQELVARGAIHHVPDGSRDGEIRGELTALETSLTDLALGGRALDIGLLYMGRLSGLRLGFEGLRPAKVSLGIDKLRLTSLALKPRV